MLEDICNPDEIDAMDKPDRPGRFARERLTADTTIDDSFCSLKKSSGRERRIFIHETFEKRNISSDSEILADVT